MNTLKIKRVYEIPSKMDGIRILVDRLWPRGVSKKDAQIDIWDKDIAPSPDLRIWFGHKAERFEEFSKKYQEELQYKTNELKEIKNLLKKSNVTLIYAAKDPKINHAIVLMKYLEDFKQ